MTYILSNTDGLLDSQGNTLLNKGRVNHNALKVGTTLTQPSSPQLYENSQLLTNDIFFAEDGTPLEFTLADVGANYESLNRIFANSEAEKLLWYAAAQTGDDLQKALDYVGYEETPSLDFSEEDNSQYESII